MSLKNESEVLPVFSAWFSIPGLSGRRWAALDIAILRRDTVIQSIWVIVARGENSDCPLSSLVV